MVLLPMTVLQLEHQHPVVTTVETSRPIHDLHQPGAIGEPEQDPVELVVGIEPGGAVAGLGHGLDQLTHLQDVLTIDRGEGESAQHGLERDPDLVQLLELVETERRHHRGGIRSHPHQSLLGEGGQRLSDLGAVEPEPGGELVLVERGARAELPGEDLPAQGRDQLLDRGYQTRHWARSTLRSAIAGVLPISPGRGAGLGVVLVLRRYRGSI